MKTIDYFRLQAKNLFKDFKARKQKYFSDDAEYIILCEYGYNEDGFCLMKAQHIIALMIGFNKWADLLNASDSELEVAKLLFENRDKIDIDDWKMYISNTEKSMNIIIDAEAKLEILRRNWI